MQAKSVACDNIRPVPRQKTDATDGRTDRQTKFVARDIWAGPRNINSSLIYCIEVVWLSWVMSLCRWHDRELLLVFSPGDTTISHLTPHTSSQCCCCWMHEEISTDLRTWTHHKNSSTRQIMTKEQAAGYASSTSANESEVRKCFAHFCDAALKTVAFRPCERDRRALCTR